MFILQAHPNLLDPSSLNVSSGTGTSRCTMSCTWIDRLMGGLGFVNESGSGSEQIMRQADKMTSALSDDCCFLSASCSDANPVH